MLLLGDHLAEGRTDTLVCSGRTNRKTDNTVCSTLTSASAAAGYVETTGYTSMYRSNTDGDLEQWISYYVDTATTATGLYARVWARYDTGDENIAIYLKDTEMRIYQRDNAVGTFLATNTAADTNEGTWYEMRIVADGTNLKVYRGERGHAMEEIFNTTVAVTTTTKLLASAEANTVVRYDNLRANTDALSTTTTYAYNNANELTSMTDYNGATSFTYDDWGRTVTKSRGGKTATYAWRYGSKLESVTTDWFDEDDVSYLYGGDHKRRERTLSGVTTGYNWGAGWGLVSEESGSGTLLRTYRGRLAHVDGTNPSSGAYEYYMHDHLGSTRGLYNQSKTLIGALEYAPYGEKYSDNAESDITHRYTGHDLDSSAGLYFAPFRYYSVNASRWMSRDPLGTADGPNMFAYTNLNPTNLWDRLGLTAESSIDGDLSQILNCMRNILGMDNLVVTSGDRDGLPHEGGGAMDLRNRDRSSCVLKRAVERCSDIMGKPTNCLRICEGYEPVGQPHVHVDFDGCCKVRSDGKKISRDCTEWPEPGSHRDPCFGGPVGTNF